MTELHSLEAKIITRHYIEHLWEPEQARLGQAVAKDGVLQLPYLAEVVSRATPNMPRYFEDLWLMLLDQNLPKVPVQGLAPAMSRELFSIYAPPLSDFELDATTVKDREFSGVEPHSIQSTMEVAFNTVGFDSPRVDSAIQNLVFRYFRNFDLCLLAAWRGRRYSLVTGLERLDRWLSAAQDTMEELAIAPGFADEYLTRDRLKVQVHHCENTYGPVNNAELLKKEPLSVILALDEGGVFPVATREEAEAIYAVYEAKLNHKVRRFFYA